MNKEQSIHMIENATRQAKLTWEEHLAVLEAVTFIKKALFAASVSPPQPPTTPIAPVTQLKPVQ